MKYIIWAFIFVTYVLMVVGLFLIIDSALLGINFAETELFKLIFGFIGIYLTIAGGYITADYLGKSWHGENPDEPDKKTDSIKWVVFTIVFIAVFTIFRLHDILIPRFFPNIENFYLSIKIAIFRFNLHNPVKALAMPFGIDMPISLLSVPGLFFMAITVTLSYLLTGMINRRQMSKDKEHNYGNC